MLVKLDHFPNFRGENKKYLRCHHLGNWANGTTNWRHEGNWDLPGDLFLSNYVSMGGRVMVDTRIRDCINQPSIFSLQNDTTAFQHVPKGMNWFSETWLHPHLVYSVQFFWMEREYLGKKYEYPNQKTGWFDGRVDPKIWGLKTKSLPSYLYLSLVTTFQQLMSLLGGWIWANHYNS